MGQGPAVVITLVNKILLQSFVFVIYTSITLLGTLESIGIDAIGIIMGTRVSGLLFGSEDCLTLKRASAMNMFKKIKKDCTCLLNGRTPKGY